PIATTLPAPLNAVVVAPDGDIATGSADGKIYFLSPEGQQRGALAVSPSPITALTMTADGRRIAAAGASGSLAIIDRRERTVLRSANGSGPPIWAIAFLPDGRTLLTGGGDRVIHRWDIETLQPRDTVAIGSPEDPLAAYAGDP